MPSSVIFVLGVEAALVFLTSLLLIQPRSVFRKTPSRVQSIAKWSGMFFLGLTFCWSIVLGVVLSMHHLTLRI